MEDPEPSSTIVVLRLRRGIPENLSEQMTAIGNTAVDNTDITAVDQAAVHAAGAQQTTKNVVDSVSVDQSVAIKTVVARATTQVDEVDEVIAQVAAHEAVDQRAAKNAVVSGSAVEKAADENIAVNAAAQATDQVAAHEGVVQKTSQNAVDSDSTTRVMAAIEGAIERAFSTMTAAVATTQVAAGIAWKAAKEAVDGNPGKVVDEKKMLETDTTLLEDFMGRDLTSVKDVKEDYRRNDGNPQTESQVKLKSKDWGKQKHIVDSDTTKFENPDFKDAKLSIDEL